MPKLLDSDLPIFQELIKDFFQETVEPKITENPLMKPITEIMNDLHLISTLKFTNKILQLVET